MTVTADVLHDMIESSYARAVEARGNTLSVLFLSVDFARMVRVAGFFVPPWYVDLQLKGTACYVAAV